LVGPHTLVAGASGSGKGSLFWSFAFALAPAIHDGRVQLHGIDLKGGMEVLMGEDLFSTRATSPSEAVALLELLVTQMRLRTRGLAGRLRAHEPDCEEPLHVVMIDELAVLTAYCPERELQRRAENALNLLCSQGRAPGFMVFACLQDPRKEVIPSRGLFTQMIGLRLKDLSETSMVLGESAVLGGAHCHRISPTVPGTGYVIAEDGGHPVRVRAGFASDKVISAVARRFATPTQTSIDASVVEDEIAARQLRRTRLPRGAE
jgi:S-DNA-T family DNA segregation ATPase FtsK/SpoIIIE